ncbi:MAG: [FeFe] hydrogenase H-cluster maturation GTPase HydF [Candidatus Goldbacteria bacterium]|nr:[FeFe] hydrogenase H-cluster maturation GTPase HydF [Candidatus Goldiibacteriota bacterium]
MNQTPAANRLQIGIFGRRNAGKSSLINALTGQNTAIVDTTPGTTTDPVGKAMEIAGIGPVFIYDTAGIDDVGELGGKRVARTKEVIHKINLAVVVTTFSTFDNLESELIAELKKTVDSVVVVFNKSDVAVRDEEKENALKQKGISYISLSCTTRENIDKFRTMLVETGSKINVENSTIIGDLINQGDVVMLVVPIDLGAPKGRLILPQVQVIRDILDNDAVTVTVKERELVHALEELKNPPALVICDSQVVLKVSGDVPDSIPLTTFSILFSRLKGDFKEFVNGTRHIDKLKDGDRVLIMEACTHHAQSDDIGRVKIPRWIRQYTGKNLEFDIVTGPYMDKDLSKYGLIISCGACMINRKEMLSRIDSSKNVSVPITNYGMAISYTQGVFERVVKPFKV